MWLQVLSLWAAVFGRLYYGRDGKRVLSSISLTTIMDMVGYFPGGTISNLLQGVHIPIILLQLLILLYIIMYICSQCYKEKAHNSYCTMYYIEVHLAIRSVLFENSHTSWLVPSTQHLPHLSG